jgi:DNA (cytosine-5)-methyltransferase 1
MNVALHTIELFAGVGMLGVGLRAGLAHLGVETRTVCYLERESYPASVLAARMEDGALDDAPVWSDVCTFDARAWRGSVDCVIGGFPCQDLSLAGRRAGLDGKRSGLFFDLLRIAEDSGARYLFLENVAGIASATASVVDEAEGALDERAAARVLGELADRGWNAEWLTLSASDVGASHGRERWFCWAWRSVADAKSRHKPRGENGRERWEIFGCAMSHVDDAECSDRRPARSARAGGQQGQDGRRAEAHGGPGEPNEILECEFCGYKFPEHLGRYECPNCEGEGLAHPTRHGRHQGRAEPGRQQWRPDAAERGGAMADAEFLDCQRRGIPGNMACTGCEAEGEARQRQRRGTAADHCECSMADASSPRCEGRELPDALHGDRGGAGSTWTN